MKGEARHKRSGYLYRQQPRLITLNHYRPWDNPDFDNMGTIQRWVGINGKFFRTRNECVRYGYR